MDGKKRTGYIHKNDVENSTNNPTSHKGIGLKSPTKVYSEASTSSKVLKSYDIGSILIYKTFTSDWYICTVYVSGKKKTGYIYKNDVESVENMVDHPQSHHGVGLKNPTKVYSKPSTDYSTLKSYAEGSILIYRDFNSNWYICTVYVKGKATLGFIRKSDVETGMEHPKSFTGIGLKSPTRVYSDAGTSFKVLKEYNLGSILKYREFTSKWYVATVYVNGNKKTGYISKNDVENAVSNQEGLDGFAIKNPTKVYSEASRSSKVLKTYKVGSHLIFRTFTSEWYEATVYVNGKKKTGYINKKDIGDQITTNYLLTLEQMIEKQLTRNPVTDQMIGYVREDAFSSINGSSGIIDGDGWRVRREPDTSDNKNVIGSLKDGQSVEILDKTKTKDRDGFYWYEIRTNISQRKAYSNEIAYYLDPSNFLPGTSEYYQLLRLSSPSGLDANEVNEKILKGEGILEGKAQAFITAAKTYDINEIYLISHAIHETGHGKSKLANGVWVTEVDGKAVKPKKVYNMYGIGATDGCAVKCGSEYAYKSGWFTPEAAIIDGAQFVSTNYIHAGQDTLYKMRWNPDIDNIWHQYATDIGWAVKQTYTFAEIYGMLENYSLIFDIPSYKK